MPKTLYLVRHAKSDWNTGETDFDRPLNKRGLRDAPEMGRRLKDRGDVPELIVCSTAKRAQQTLAALDLGVANVIHEPRIYEASTGDLLELVQKLDDSVDAAMLIGHNPSMTWLASMLSGVRIEGMPTCSVATIVRDTNRWEAAGAMAAIVSGCYVVSSNRVGPGRGEVRFGGNGFAFAPDGTCIARTSAAQPVVSIEIDPERVVRQRAEYPCYVDEL